MWGRPHPDPAVEKEARRRAGTPPLTGNAIRWLASLERHRDVYFVRKNQEKARQMATIADILRKR